MKRLSFGFCSYMFLTMCHPIFSCQQNKLKNSLGQLPSARAIMEEDDTLIIKRCQSVPLSPDPDLEDEYDYVYNQVDRQQIKTYKARKNDPKLSKKKIIKRIQNAKQQELAASHEEEDLQIKIARIALEKAATDAQKKLFNPNAK